MAGGMGGLLTQKEFLLGTMHMRQDVSRLVAYPQHHAFTGPVAVLIDGGSASTSEILTAGLKEAGRSRIFGSHSAGAALPSLFKTLPTGDLFQYAIADFETPDGLVIEGNGINPDTVVASTREDLSEGRDRVMEAARSWISQQLANRDDRASLAPDQALPSAPKDHAAN